MEDHRKTETIQYERALLAGVNLGNDEDEFLRSMEELKNLAKACNMEPVAVVTQHLDHTNKALYLGTGKVQEVKEAAQVLAAETAETWFRWRCLRWEMLAVSPIGAGMALRARWSGALALFPGAPMKAAVLGLPSPNSPGA